MTFEATFFRLDGKDIAREAVAKEITAETRWIETGGEIVRLANGARRSLRRPQFRKLAVSVRGAGLRKPPISHLGKGDEVTIDLPDAMVLDGDVADADLPRPAAPGNTPGTFRIFRFGDVNGKPVRLEHGDPKVLRTMFVPRLRIMLDEVTSEYDDKAAVHRWTLTGEEV